MADMEVLCAECKKEVTKENQLLCGPNWENGQTLCEECFHKLEEVQWHKNISKIELIDLLNIADHYRWQTFYISYKGGDKWKYVAAKECYPSVFSVMVSREELVTLISEKDS